jgi:hypothetical protein
VAERVFGCTSCLIGSGRIRLMVFQVLAALVGLVFLAAVMLAVPATGLRIQTR